jgi:hypothetical protein
VLDTALAVPPPVNIRVESPVLVVKILPLGLRMIHAIQTQPIEVLLRVSLGLEHHRLPLHAATAHAGGHVGVREVSKARDDLLNRRVADDVLDGEDIDLGECVEVAADGGVPTAAGFGAVAEKVAAFLVEALV